MTRKKLNRGVALVGAGMSKFGAFPEKSSRDLFVEAFQSMRQSVDKDFEPADIETIYIGNFSSDLFESQSHTAPIMADVVGLAGQYGLVCGHRQNRLAAPFLVWPGAGNAAAVRDWR